MQLFFRKVSDFNRGLLFDMLKDAYSFDIRYQNRDERKWIDFDKFFFDNLSIADKYGFITCLDDNPIGFVSWDPRNRPEYVEIGHNCIRSMFKGKGYGKLQMQEAVRRILMYDNKLIKVSTDLNLLPAQKMYESAGFKRVGISQDFQSGFTTIFYEQKTN